MQSRLRRSKPHTTTTGRIVYDRAIHYFGAADLERISGSIIEHSDDDPGFLYGLLEKINLFMLGKILALFGAEEFKAVALQFLLRLVSQILSWLRAIAGNLFLENVSHTMYIDLIQYLPEKDRIQTTKV